MPVRNVNLTTPNPYATDLAAIERRRRIAELMQQQSIQPLPVNQMAGGWAVPLSPMQGLGKIAQGISGSYQQSRADEEAKKLSEKYMEDYRRTVARGLREWQGTPPTEGQESLAFEGGRGAPQPGVAANPQAAMATFGEHPLTQSFGQALAAQMMRQQQPTSIGAGGLRMPSGEIIPPAARPQGPQAIGSGGLYMPSGQVIPPAARPMAEQGKWSDPYQMGGAWVQRNELTGQIRQSVGREPQVRVYNQPAPTLTEIVDPNDPNRMIRVVVPRGATGTVGVSGKEPTVAKREEKEAQGKELLKSELENLRGDFDLLYKQGAIPSSEGGALANIGAWTRGTTVGQIGGRMIGTREQDSRNRIQSARLRLLNGIKNATGMSAQQLNSNAELQTWLDSLTSLTGSYESNTGIIDAIERAFLKQASNPAAPRGQPGLPTADEIDAELRRRGGG